MVSVNNKKMIIKKITISILAVTILAVGALLFLGKSNAVGSTDVRIEYSDGNVYTATSTAIVYLTPSTASSSISFNAREAKGFDFNLCATASSSAAVLKYQIFYAPTENVITASTTWYQETREAVSAGAITHSLAEHSLSLATTTTGANYVCANIDNPVSAKWVKIKMGAQGASTTIWRVLTPEVEL